MATTVQPWKSVNPNRSDNLQTERSVRVLDRQTQLMNDQVINDFTTILGNITTINTAITNITNGTTTVYAKWSSYSGAVWLLWFLWSAA